MDLTIHTPPTNVVYVSPSTGYRLVTYITGPKGDTGPMGTGYVSLSGEYPIIYNSGVISLDVDYVSGIITSGFAQNGSGASVGLVKEVSGVLNSKIDLLSGNSQNFTINIDTGIDTLFISYPNLFSIPPIVNPSMIVTDNTTYYYSLKNITTSGFFVYFSDVIAESGISLSISAKI